MQYRENLNDLVLTIFNLFIIAIDNLVISFKLIKVSIKVVRSFARDNLNTLNAEILTKLLAVYFYTFLF